MMEPQLETVIVELTPAVDGRQGVNIRGMALQDVPGGAWERIVQILQLGLRAAILQTIAPAPEPSRILLTNGLRVPPPLQR